MCQILHISLALCDDWAPDDDERVPDAGAGGHSYFAAKFLQILKENQDHIISREVYDKIVRLPIFSEGTKKVERSFKRKASISFPKG